MLQCIILQNLIIILIFTSHSIVHQNVPERNIVYGNNVIRKGIVETLDYLLKTELISVLVHTVFMHMYNYEK